MARRSRNDGTKELATILTIGFVGGFFLIKWMIEALVFFFKAMVWLFAAIGSLIVYISDKISHKNTANKIMKKPFEETKINPKQINKIDTIEEVKQTLNLFDKSIYDNDFEKQIRNRGEQYYNEDKIKYLRKYENNKYTCKVQGSEEYKVSIKLNDNNEIEEASCSCPYFTDKEKNCKHIYGALFKIKCDDNQNTIKEEIKKYIDGIKTMIENSKKYINNNRSHFTSSILSDHNDICSRYENIINNIESRVERCNIEDTLINMLLEIMNHQKDLKQKIKKILDSESTMTSATKTTQSYNTKPKKNKVGLGDVLVGMAIANELDNHSHKNDDYDEKLEKEMDNYVLEDWQKDLVRQGHYDPWNFQEPGEDGPLEEDDYYYEDDD